MTYDPKSVASFLRRVDKAGECWLWTGGKTDRGYGSFRREGFRVAHRFSYALAHGSVPEGSLVCHTCDRRLCVRPEHLYAGTHGDNMHDMSVRDRHGHAKLTGGDVRRMLVALADGETTAVLAAAFQVTKSCVRHIKTGRTWKHIDRGQPT